jgi:hypothetical protein
VCCEGTKCVDAVDCVDAVKCVDAMKCVNWCEAGYMYGIGCAEWQNAICVGKQGELVKAMWVVLLC